MAETFATRSVSFHDIHFPDVSIDDDCLTFITGDSGTGKTTLMKLFNNTYSPDAGQILYRGKNVEEYDPIQLRREALLVNQSVYLADDTIAANFAMFYSIREASPPSQDDMNRYLTLCQAPFPLDNKVTTMSGGERQRVFIAICLSFRPKVLMLDEPTSALDTENADALFDNLKKVRGENNMALITVSHDAGLVERYAEATVTLQRRDG